MYDVASVSYCLVHTFTRFSIENVTMLIKLRSSKCFLSFTQITNWFNFSKCFNQFDKESN